MMVPLAEHFHSVQGEGHWVGLPMHFMRFPGCNVGRTQGAHGEVNVLAPNPFVTLPNAHVAKVCTAFDGQQFFCDTDYDKHEEVSIEQLVDETYEGTACFTGGEPLIHKGEWMAALFATLRRAGKKIHIETSGTIYSHWQFDWITVSPKSGWRQDMVWRADQVKFLITKDTTLESLDAVNVSSHSEIWLSPVFDPNELVPENLEQVMQLLRQRPTWRLGVQWHKFLGLR